MAILKQGIFGGLSGSAGNVTFSSWKGINIAKTKPLSVANPRTAAQVEQRSNFSGVVAFAKAILVPVIKPLRDRFAVKQSGYNTFVSTNIEFFVAGLLSNKSRLSISEGNLTEIASLTVAGNVPSNELDLTWDDNTAVGNASPSDTLYVAIWNEDKEQVVGFNTGILRSALAATIVLDFNIDAGDLNNTWASFRKADGTAVSNTSYVFTVLP
jgi:hypothetical protein